MENSKKKKLLGGCTGKGFMPGQSGNPKGRKKGRHLSHLLFDVGTLSIKLRGDKDIKEVVTFFGLDPRRRYTVDELSILALRYGAIKQAARGKIDPLVLTFERIEGKVTQPLDLNPEGPIEVVHIPVKKEDVAKYHDLLRALNKKKVD